MELNISDLKEAFLQLGRSLECISATLEYANLIRRDIKDLLGKSFFSFHPFDEDSKVRLQLQEAMAQSQPLTAEEFNNDLGQWFEYRLQPNAEGFSLLILDRSTDRTRHEQLSKRLKFYRSSFESAPVGISHIDSDGQWLRMNPAMKEILGAGRDSILSQNFFALFAPLESQAHREAFSKLWHGELEVYSKESQILRQDGNLHWVLMKVRLIRNSQTNPQCFVAFFDDIEIRKAHEHSADLALQMARIGTWNYNSKRNLFFTTPQFNEIFGVDPLTQSLTFEDILSRLLHQDQQIFIREFERALGRNAHFSVTLPVMGESQGPRQVSFLAQITWDPTQGSRRMSGLIMDITPEKKTKPLKQRVVESLEGRPDLKGLRALIADDSEDNLHLIQNLLTRVGVSTELAINGHEAIEKALHDHYDLVLMDMKMPEVDGFEATRYLRESGFINPIVAITASAMREDREKCLAAGCSDYITKPVDSKRLYKLIEECVHEKLH